MDEKKRIGIKIADGTFFPVLEGKTDKKKRLVLTTVNDNQTSVQIDLYEGTGDDFEDPSYVGTLVIDNIAPAEKGAPEIEMVVGFDSDSVLSATAKDLASGSEESLSVSVESFDEETTYDVPEFTLEDDDFTFDEEEYSSIDEEILPEETETPVPEETDEDVFGEPEEPESPEEETPVEKRRMSPLWIFLLVILALAVLGGVIYLVYNSLGSEKSPVLQAQNVTSEADKASKAVTVKSGGDAVSKPAEAEKPAAPAAEKTAVPAVSPAESPPAESPPPASLEAAKKTDNNGQGVWYRIRWGDTLWGISYSFYKSPTMYAKIVKENKIKDPDLIFAETKIFIPKE